MKKWLYAILFLFASQMSWANRDTLSIAEQNAQQGFNDNINRLADDFVDVYVVVSTPGDVLYSILGHAALYLVCRYFSSSSQYYRWSTRHFRREFSIYRFARFVRMKNISPQHRWTAAVFPKIINLQV